MLPAACYLLLSAALRGVRSPLNSGGGQLVNTSPRNSGEARGAVPEVWEETLQNTENTQNTEHREHTEHTEHTEHSTEKERAKNCSAPILMLQVWRRLASAGVARQLDNQLGYSAARKPTLRGKRITQPLLHREHGGIICLNVNVPVSLPLARPPLPAAS